jgi:hypothetical protein
MLKSKSNNGYRSIMLSNGVLLSGVDISSIGTEAEMRSFVDKCAKDDNKLIGYTDGAIKFKAASLSTQYYKDGEVFARREGNIIEKWDIMLEVSLNEFNPDSIIRLLRGTERIEVTDSHNLLYITSCDNKNNCQNLVWVGELVGGGLMVIDMNDVYCVKGFSFDTSTDGETRIRAAFKPFMGIYENQNEPPFNIIFLN